jgi:hypothetical protein
MISNLRILFISILIPLLFGTCQNRGNKTSDSFLKDLSEKRIGDSKFKISLPRDYSIKEKRGEDFSVYYFNPIDSTNKDSLSGGIYFGNYPSEFKPDNDSCKIEKINSKLLNHSAEWKVYDCNNQFSLQTIVTNDKNEGWDELIHAFGSCKSKEDLIKLLLIYSTMKNN